jgi:hypothetical protein
MDYLHSILQVLRNIEACLKIIINQPVEQQRVLTDLNAEQWMDRQAVQTYLQISERTFFRLKKDGVLKAQRIGGRDYFYKPNLMAALQVSILKGRI